MNMIHSIDTLVGREVERLFNDDACRFFGEICKIPVMGGHYVPGMDAIDELKEMACRALLAREWFALNGPADAQPLPLSHGEREELKIGGLLHILAWYARSLEALDYDVLQHPSFDDYARGVMASEHAPEFIREHKEMLRRFPPRHLEGFVSGLYWRPQPRPKN